MLKVKRPQTPHGGTLGGVRGHTHALRKMLLSGYFDPFFTKNHPKFQISYPMALPGTQNKAYISQTGPHKQLVFKGLRGSYQAICSKMKPVFSVETPPAEPKSVQIPRGQKRWVYYKGDVKG